MKYWIGDREGLYDKPYGGRYWVFRGQNALVASFVVDITMKKYFGLEGLIKKKQWDRVEGFLKSNKAKINCAYRVVADNFGVNWRSLLRETFLELASERWPDFNVVGFIE